MKKTAALLLTMLLCAAAFGAPALEMTGLETEMVDRNWENHLFFSRMAALTGIEVQAAGVSEKSDYEKLLAAMEKGEVTTDVLFKANLTREQEISLLDSGALIDLAPMIEEHMPNLSALLSAHPDWREVITLEDGRIASLPLFNERERQVMVWINRAWLEKLGKGMPENTQELTDALVAIRDGDPNGNGRNDEKAADLTGVYEMRWLLPYFGIVADDYNLMRDEAGAIAFAPGAPQYRAFVEYLKGWYELGVFAPEAFTDVHSTAALNETQENAPLLSGLLVSMTPYTHMDASYVTDYAPVLLPGPDGSIRWRDLLGEVWTGCFAVTSRCKDPAQALRWADALYTTEGAMLGFAGVEGEDYSLTADGSWSLILDGGRSVNDIRSDVLMYTGTAMPGLYPADFIYSVNSEVDRHVFAANDAALAVSERVTLAYALDEAQRKEADALNAVLARMVDEGIARFVTGETELNDETYAAWLTELKAAGSDRLAALFGEAK